MNLHPIFVHFPIAFLTLYSIVVILPFEKYFSKFDWSLVRKVVLIAGVLGAFASIATGEMGQGFSNGSHNIK